MRGRIVPLGCSLGFWAALIAPSIAADTGDRWEADIRKFEEADRQSPPAPGQVVFVGSSSIRLWKLKESFPDVPVINRGFGGSQLGDAAKYAERIVTPYKPRVVVVYAGDNDLAAGKAPTVVRDDYKKFVAAVRGKQPDVKIVFIAIKPSPKRWALADQAKEANRLVRAEMKDPNQVFVNVWPYMIGTDGKPRRELYVQDELHMTPEGYKVWVALVRRHIEAK
jgi:lysophospholipase L1-like esterase